MEAADTTSTFGCRRDLSRACGLSHGLAEGGRWYAQIV